MLIFTNRPIKVKEKQWMAKGKIYGRERACWIMHIRVCFVIHKTYIIVCNEIFDEFASGIIFFITPENIMTIKVS